MTKRQKQALFRGVMYAVFVLAVLLLLLLADWPVIRRNFLNLDFREVAGSVLG